MAKTILSQARVKELLHYDQATGRFTWAAGRGYNMVGKLAGSKHPSGYIHICVDGHRLKGHQIAWLYMTGDQPRDRVVDHINCARADNRWVNLRLADRCENAWNARRPKNSTSGSKGVSFHKATGKWQVRIRVRGRQMHVGLFPDIESAELAFAVVAEKHHGEFFRVE